jgi:hypothetical protein
VGRSNRMTRRLAIFVILVAAVLSAPFARDARACGLFVAGPMTEAEIAQKVPYLSVERVLLAWDATTQTEDFVREARFEKANQAFGFVVPVPSRPEVFEVKKAPFDDLARVFPYYVAPPMTKGVGGGAHSAGAAVPTEPVVLSQQRIGSFTATVLAASDAEGLARWLKANGFEVPPPARAWLDHFVGLGFYYVAFRYDAAVAASPGMTSETVRIRFQTPMPYYPYLEPTHPDAPRGSRDLLLWYASQEERVPMASVRSADGAVTWKQPWEGSARHVTAKRVRDVLSSLGEIIHGDDTSPWVITPYRDEKESREGWGDVLLVPASPAAIDDEAIASRWRLLPVLDPRLEGDLDEKPLTAATIATAPPSTSAPPETPPAPSSEPASSHGCEITRGAPTEDTTMHVALLVVACAVATARRRRRLFAFVAFVALGSCKPSSSAPTSGPGPTPSVMASSAPPARDEREVRERSVLALMFGRTNASRFPVDARIRAAGPMGLGNVSGDAVLDPPTAAEGPLPEGAARVIATLRPGFRACYNQGLQSDPGMSGKVTISVKILPNGEVASAEATKNTGVSAGVIQCAVRRVRNAQFDSPGSKGSTIQIPVIFVHKDM